MNTILEKITKLLTRYTDTYTKTYTTSELFNNTYTYYGTLKFWAKQTELSKTLLANVEFIQSQMDSQHNCDDSEIIPHLWNPSSFGNVASVALHGPNEELKAKAMILFNRMKVLILTMKQEDIDKCRKEYDEKRFASLPKMNFSFE